MKIHGVGDGCTVELYTASYTGKLLYNARNRPIQQTLSVPRTFIVYSRYSARVYSRAIQYTAYTLYSPLRRPSAPMPPLHEELMGMATLATVDAARVGPRLLETEDSGRALLGHYHSGIYRDSHLNRLINNTRNHSFLFRSAQRWTHLARPQTRAARHRG